MFLVFALMAISAVAQEQEAVVDSTFFHFPVYHLEQAIEPDGGWEEFDSLIAESDGYDLTFIGQADLKTEAYDELSKPTDLRLDPKGRLLQNMGQEFIARQRAMVARDRVGRGQVLGRVVDSPDDRGLKVFRTPRELSGGLAALIDEAAEAAPDSSEKEEATPPDTTQKVAEADSTEAGSNSNVSCKTGVSLLLGGSYAQGDPLAKVGMRFPISSRIDVDLCGYGNQYNWAASAQLNFNLGRGFFIGPIVLGGQEFCAFGDPANWAQLSGGGVLQIRLVKWLNLELGAVAEYKTFCRVDGRKVKADIVSAKPFCSAVFSF